MIGRRLPSDVRGNRVKNELKEVRLARTEKECEFLSKKEENGGEGRTKETPTTIAGTQEISMKAFHRDKSDKTCLLLCFSLLLRASIIAAPFLADLFAFASWLLKYVTICSLKAPSRELSCPALPDSLLSSLFRW